MGKTQLQPYICERNSSADSKVREEAGGRGIAGVRIETTLQTLEKQARPYNRRWRGSGQSGLYGFVPAAHGGWWW